VPEDELDEWVDFIDLEDWTVPKVRYVEAFPRGIMDDRLRPAIVS